MVVEISNEVIEYLEKNISQLTCDSPICLNLNIIAYECYNHEHFLYAEYSVLEYLKNYPLLSDVSKQVYTYFFSKCYNLSSYIASTKISICYYMGDNIKHCGDKFFIPITKKNNLKQSLLICEDLSDCTFYISLVKEILNESKCNLSLSLHKLQCAGSQALETIDNEIEPGIIRPIACIMDSDKKQESDPTGSSANSALSALSEHQDTYVISVHVLHVRAKENVIPPNLLSIHSQLNTPLVKKLSTGVENPKCYDLLKFINLKNGIKDLRASKEYTYYKDAFELLGICPPDESDGSDPVNFNGIGSKGMDCFVRDVLNHQYDKEYTKLLKDEDISEDTKQKKKRQADQSHELLNNLPDYIKQQWDDIKQLIIDYGITIPPTFGFIS